MDLDLLSASRRRFRISPTNEACNVGVNLRGSNGLKPSSSGTSSISSLFLSGEILRFCPQVGDIEDGVDDESLRSSHREDVSPGACLMGVSAGVWTETSKASEELWPVFMAMDQ